jgi:hypothetical protein
VPEIIRKPVDVNRYIFWHSKGDTYCFAGNGVTNNNNNNNNNNGGGGGYRYGGDSSLLRRFVDQDSCETCPDVTPNMFVDGFCDAFTMFHSGLLSLPKPCADLQ